jgi:hypothetical protein
MIIENIGDLNLHDSEWISTTVRTTDEGDENIVLELDYLLDYKEFETRRKALTFVRCWGATFKMNFRFSGPDSILSGEEKSDSTLIREIEKKWGAVNPVPIGRVRHFAIKAGLTGSQLEVVAEELHLTDSN